MTVLSQAKRIIPWLPVATVSIAGAVILYSFVMFFQVLTAAPKLPAVGMTGSAPRASQPMNDIADLFGKTPALLKVAEGGLMLRGIFATVSPQTGAAIIAMRGQKPKLYIVGDQLPNGTTLIAVHEQQVVLEKAGEKSMLSLPQLRL